MEGKKIKCYKGVKNEDGEGNLMKQECEDGVTQCVKGPAPNKVGFDMLNKYQEFKLEKNSMKINYTGVRIERDKVCFSL